MDVQELKNYLLENNSVENILSELGCEHIQIHSGSRENYLTCSNPDGDNKTAVNLYLNNGLTVINHTRDISGKGFNADIFTLIEFYRKCSFFEAVKWCCEIAGISQYHNFDEELPKSILFMKELNKMKSNGNSHEDDTPLKPINEIVLSYYNPVVNDMFRKDGISYETQQEFEIGYDESTNRITIPIRDETGTLVGVKGRLFKDKIDADELRYLYLEPCGRGKVLYGMYKTYEHIKNEGKCFITESEKSVLAFWSYGYKNVVGLGGLAARKPTMMQIEKLSRLSVDLYFCLDKDIEKEELKNIANLFMEGIKIFAIYDKDNMMKDKDSPSDNKDTFDYLMKNCVIRLR